METPLCAALHHLEAAVDLIAERLTEGRKCGNCGVTLASSDVAYLIQKDTVAGLVTKKATVLSLVLCPGCYENNWAIGEPDEV